MVLSKALEVYDTLMKELNDCISPLTNITLASYALTVFRNRYMPKDTLVVATEEEHEFAQKSLNGGKLMFVFCLENGQSKTFLR